MIEIASVVPEDAPGIYKVFKDTWLATYPSESAGITRDDILAKYPDDKYEETTTRWQSFYEKINSDPDSATTLIWTAKEDGEIVGVVTIDKAAPIRIGALYVLPEKQGLGIGRQLMEFVLNYLGPQDITLNVANYNSKAIDFYKKFGFTEAGPIEDPYGVLPSGKRIPEIQMRKNA